MSIKGNAESNVLRGRISDPDKIHGLSAYELDVMRGYDGTLDEWLKEVRGDFDDKVAEAKAEFNNEVDTVIVPEAKAEIESTAQTATENAVAEIADAETRCLRTLGDYTNEATDVLERAASVLDENEVLLWENNAIGDPFVGQDIILSDKLSNDIKHFRLVFFDLVGTVTSDGVFQSNVLPSIELERGQNGIVRCEQGSRLFNVFDNGNIRFEGATSNASCIPWRVYGVKNKEISLDAPIREVKAESNNLYTNALKGKSSGAIVALDDVSPLEHKVKVKLSSETLADDTAVTLTGCGKNLFDVSKVPSLEHAHGVIGTNNGDGSITIAGYSYTTLKLLKDLAPYLKAGDTATFSIDYDIEPDGKFMLLSKTNTYFYFDQSRTITDAMLNDTVIFYGKRDGTPVTLSNIQIERGTTETPYEPFKEGTTVSTTIAEGAELPSVAPNMTILTDKSGVVIEANYNKDSNIVIEKLTQAIISFGGNI